MFLPILPMAKINPTYAARRNVINLRDCFPIDKEGFRGPLPKQATFLEAALNPKAAKYIRYNGGVGSGKTIIGCITVLHWAVLHRGEYLIARQFMPELKDTTYAAFKEICPPELVIEDRIADMAIFIKTADGGRSKIMFRGLEEPDKLRSLNLSGFYIDEAAQVSEAAFILLQGRLRGSGLRKGIITQNPGGHNWCWRWFVKQDHFNYDSVKKQFLNVQAPSTENHHLPEGYVETMKATWSPERVLREIMGSDDAFEGMVYSEFNRAVHVIQPFRIPEEWTKVIGIDHGYRNPSAWIYGAVDYDGTVYVYDEYYDKEKLVRDVCKANMNKIGQTKIEQARIDPSTRARRGTTGLSDYDAYLEALPSGFPLLMANNDKTAGIDRVKGHLKVDANSGKPKLFIFSTCSNLIDEVSKYRYAELPAGRQGKHNEKEEPLKVDDHACDALRYLIMTRPETILPKEDIYKKLQYHSLEGMLYRELEHIKKPQPKDPFE